MSADRLSAEIESIIINRLVALPLRGKFGCIMRCEDHPEFYALTAFVDYEGVQVWAMRKRVDELDQVTVAWI